MSQRRYAVVYQMGKVASTSLVATLEKHPDITAVQSHFLGVDALKEILPSILSSNLGDYFYFHQFGQFKANVEVTRRINMILAGQVDERLLILSLSRDPVDWFRSSLVQDMQAYAPQLVAYATRHGLAGQNDDETICRALTHVLRHFAEILERRGGIDAHFEKRRQGYGEGFEDTPLASDAHLQQIFRMMLRPYRWFEEHFERATGLDLCTFERTGDVYLLSNARADYMVMRYEDIDKAFVPALASIGIDVQRELEAKNISHRKPFAVTTRAAFLSKAGLALSSVAQRTRYAHRFGYSFSDS